MGLIPNRKQLSKFADDHPLLSLFYIGMISFTAVDVLSSFTLPKGKGPLSPRGNLGSYAPNYMTRSTLSSMEADVASLQRQIDTNAKVPDWAESKIYTAADRLDTVENYMSHRSNLGHLTANQQAKVNKIEAELKKASKMHASQARRISQLGATTSTSTSTSSSHPPIVRERMLETANGGLSGFHGAGMGHCNCAQPDCPSCAKKGMGSHCGTRGVPPAMRRRLMARTLETEVSGSHLGKQSVANDTQINNVGQMFGLSGLIPETGSGWTE